MSYWYHSCISIDNILAVIGVLYILSKAFYQHSFSIFGRSSSYQMKEATLICVKIGSGNGLLPDDTKPLPEPM